MAISEALADELTCLLVDGYPGNPLTHAHHAAPLRGVVERARAWLDGAPALLPDPFIHYVEDCGLLELGFGAPSRVDSFVSVTIYPEGVKVCARVKRRVDGAEDAYIELLPMPDHESSYALVLALIQAMQAWDEKEKEET